MARSKRSAKEWCKLYPEFRPRSDQHDDRDEIQCLYCHFVIEASSKAGSKLAEHLETDRHKRNRRKSKDNQHSGDKGYIQKYDWTCYKCGVNNFKRREQCFKCGTPREESAANETGDEVSPTPTNCLLLRNLSPDTSEERILTMLGTITSLPIKSIRIPKDSVYGISRGVCFVELHTTSEASQLFTLLSSLHHGFVVDDFPLTINYAKRNMPSTHHNATAVNAASMALAAAQWTNQTDNGTSIPATSLSTEYVTPMTSERSDVTEISKSDVQGKGSVNVNGVMYQKYPTPDVSKYQYDKSSGYYYDPSTCLYYDAKSHYYYNSATQAYLYWSSEHETYLPVDTSVFTATGATSENATEKSKDKIKEKQDKVKIAKKIAKDMEKWAKTLNQKKEISKIVNYTAASACGSEETLNAAVVTSDGSNDGISEVQTNPVAVVELKEKTEENEQFVESLRYSPSHIASAIIESEEARLTDWDKLLCLLCKRQFSKKEQLEKHQQISELHKSNLEVLKRSKLTDEQLMELQRKEANYRDRAKERRKKYGLPETPEPNKFKEKYLDDAEPETTNAAAAVYNNPINDSNIGNKMLKAMGWSEGQGLGRTNQGRANIIEVERRTGCAGLGIRSSYGSGESYKDAVRRAMQQRFKELSEKE